MDDHNTFISYSDKYTVPFIGKPGFSGTADTEIKVWIPKGKELTPDCSVKWNFGGMNIFGKGFSLSLPYFERMTINGVPSYDFRDTFRHSSYGVLNAGNPGTLTNYYPCSEVSFSKIQYMSDTDTFREMHRDGTITLYEQRITSETNPGFIYFPTSMTGPRGTTIRYHYLDTGEIAEIEYEDLPDGGHAFIIDFSYEPRPDIMKNYRGGFLYEELLRCSQIAVSTRFEEKIKLREVSFTYSDVSGYSLLKYVSETAFSGDSSEKAPVIQVTWQNSEEKTFSDITLSSVSADIGASIPVNFNHEGACGLLAQYSLSAYYSPPVHSENNIPCFGPKILLDKLPANFTRVPPDTIFHRYAGNFLDLDGDGGLEWVASDGSGYYEIKDGEFKPFVKFENVCPMGSNTEFADIYGDGRLSAFTVTETGKKSQCEIFRGLGRKGFGSVQIVNLPDGFPSVSVNRKELVGFVRFFGDGLFHRIMLRQKSCIVFPNLGSGIFGESIVVPNAPDFGDDFDAERIRFADTNGSGTDDIIYIEQHHIKIYQNIGGAFFLFPVKIRLPEPYSVSDSLYFTDFLGDMLPQLIFIKRSPSGNRAYSLHFKHNHLISRVENGFGLNIEMEYTSSAKFQLADTACSRPWDIIPPCHVPVVSMIRSSEGISGETNIIHYSYRNGRYIKNWRALPGFGEVEETHMISISFSSEIPSDSLPPAKKIVYEYFIGDSVNPKADMLALIGALLSTKEVDMDDMVFVHHNRKYKAEEQKDSFQMSFFPALIEEQTEQFGKISRVTKVFHNYDGYGNISETKIYNLPSADAKALDEQQKGHITITSYKYMNIDTEKKWIIGIPLREMCSAGTTADDLSLVSLKEYYYSDPETNQVLPFGTCKTPLLNHHNRNGVFTADDPNISGLHDILVSKCNYYFDNTHYYTLGEIYEYDSDNFYQVVSKTLGSSVSKITYDKYNLFVTGLERILTDETSLNEYYKPDYTALAYNSKTDVNGNTEYYYYNAFSQLCALSYSTPISEWKKPQSLSDVITSPEIYLQNGVDVFFYHTCNAWEDAKEPMCCVSVKKKESDSNGTKPELALKLSYYDGYGRSCQTAVQDTDQWIISDKIIYGRDMKIFEYLPYYSPEPNGEPEGIYPRVYVYDILNRVIKVYTPYSKPSLEWCSVETEYQPWYTRLTDNRLSPAEACEFRQDLDSRGIAFTDVYEGAEGDVLRSKAKKDARGNIISAADGRLAAAGMNNITYSYDLLGREIKTVSSDAGTSLKLYDHAGHLIYESSKGLSKIYTYDTLGRFTSLSIQEKNSESKLMEQIVWGESAPNPQENNLIGNVYKRVDSSGTTVYGAYDHFGKALSIKRIHSNEETVSARYSYNLAGELTAAVTESFALMFTYNSAGRLSTVSSPEGEIISNFNYTAEGHLGSQTCSNGLHLSQNYNSITRAIARQSVRNSKIELYKAEYDFTKQGNLAAVNLEMSGMQPLTTTYTYDVHSRLIQADESQGLHNTIEKYSYDNGGNLVSFTRTQDSKEVITRSFEIAADSNRIDAVVINGTRFEYRYNDYGARERLMDGQELFYDEFGRLSYAKSENGLEEYTYDNEGRRVGKTASDNSYTTYFRGDPLAGDYVRLSNHHEMLKLNFGGLLNTIFYKEESGTCLFWQVTDQRESILLTTDCSGNVLFHEWFSPYGEDITDDGDGGAPETPLPISYRFSGKEYDSNTGLYYFGARYYSPEDGRMITPDDTRFAHPVQLSGLNLYAYCLGNPETFVDSNGNWPAWLGPLILKVLGSITTLATGITSGIYSSAITPQRASLVAGASSTLGTLIEAPGGSENRMGSSVTTGVHSTLYSAGINIAKEMVLAFKPDLAHNHPIAVAAVTTGVNAAAVIGWAAWDMSHGMNLSLSKYLGALGGGMLGVIQTFMKDSNNTSTSPRTLGNTLRQAQPQHIYQADPPGIATHYFCSVDNAGRQTQHMVLDLNATEAHQWNGKSNVEMTEMLTVRHGRQDQTTLANIAVIVHGERGGYTFIDGNSPTHPIQGGNSRPDYHTMVNSTELANYVLSHIGDRHEQNFMIKLISCHGAEGGESLAFFRSSAQTLANVTGAHVAAYDNAISISETCVPTPLGRPPLSAKIYIPK